MNKKNAGFGLFLLLVGLIWLLVSTGVITWSVFGSLRVLWPLIIIVVGLNMIFKNRTFKIVSWVLLVAVVIGYGYYHNDEHSKKSDINGIAGGTTIIEKKDETTIAELDVGIGAIKMEVVPGTRNLLEAEIDIPRVTHSFRSEGERAYISFRKSDDYSIGINRTHKGRFILDKDMVWSLDFKTGAFDADLSLDDLKVDRLEIKGGAGNTYIKIGSRHDKVDVVIKGAAMNIDIDVPEDVGVRIDRSGLAFSIKTGSGWEKTGNRLQTPGYDEAEVKINIDATLVAGSLKVKAG